MKASPTCKLESWHAQHWLAGLPSTSRDLRLDEFRRANKWLRWGDRAPRARPATPSTAATAASAAEDPLSQFNTLYNGMAYVVGIVKNVPNDMTWDGTAQMTLKGIRHNTLIQDYVVLMQGVCGGQGDTAEAPLQSRGSRLIQRSPPPASRWATTRRSSTHKAQRSICGSRR